MLYVEHLTSQSSVQIIQIIKIMPMKPMNSKYVIMEKSAMEHSSKLSILSNDLVRRLLNTKEDIHQERKDQIIDEYSLKLLRSGYSVNVTRTILISGLRSFNKKITAAKQSGQPLHRPAHTSLESRLRKKIFQKTSWFKGQKKIQKTPQKI